MIFILLIIVGIIAIEIGGLRGRIAAYRQEVIDVKTYYNKVLRNNAEITAALFPQIIRELEEVGHISEANRCKKVLADAEMILKTEIDNLKIGDI